ncbi:unnamed protein product [Spirodela intermedia]|uniref:Uncharacterized protein n=1 Tax=Spirodela intermedia TaxID=51605 RepID=A0A7I8L5J5_SPIIN|nr:unnamed protein product [Spirodela intermedia]
MACMKLGSKSDAFKRQGQAWFCSTGLPSDVTVEVEDMAFHLHKFPLLSRSGLLERLIRRASAAAAAAAAEEEEEEEEEEDEEEEEGDGGCVVRLAAVPGGAATFELVAKFCYGVKVELTAANVVGLRCAAEHLEMTEEYGEGNLVAQTEVFLNQVVLRRWKESVAALRACEGLLPLADDLRISRRCVESLAAKAVTDPGLFGWPVMEHGGAMQSPGGSVLWNGISTGARPRSAAGSSADWWYEDATALSLPFFKRLLSAMDSRGVRREALAGAIVFYAQKHLPGLARRHSGAGTATPPATSEEQQRHLLEEMEALLPGQRGMVPTRFLFGMLRAAMILRAGAACVAGLERRIGGQLDQAALEDLLLPTFSHSMETLYDVDCVQRILGHFLAADQAADQAAAEEPLGLLAGSPSLAPLTAVARLIDAYLAEVAPDPNLKLTRFQAMAADVPDYARPLDDALYRAIDIYLKAHPWMGEGEREKLCRVMDCQKLSLEACTHAAQNERLPLRVVVQVLFFEQLQLKSSIASCFLVSENLDGSRALRSGGAAEGTGGGGGWATAARENQVLKVGMDSMRMRVSELEKECSTMKEEIEKLGRGRSSGGGGGGGWASVVPRKLGMKIKSQMCSAQEGSVDEHRSLRGGNARTVEMLQAKLSKKYE